MRGDVACYVAQARAPIDAETCPPLAGWAKRPFVDGNYLIFFDVSAYAQIAHLGLCMILILDTKRIASSSSTTNTFLKLWFCTVHMVVLYPLFRGLLYVNYLAFEVILCFIPCDSHKFSCYFSHSINLIFNLFSHFILIFIFRHIHQQKF